jgi:hypothetical protein
MAEIKRLTIRDILLLLVFAGAGGFFLLNNAGVVETGLRSEAAAIAKECRALENKETCYGKAFENLTKTTEWNHAFDVLRELQTIEPQSRGCHFIAHSITIAETQKDTSKWKDIMNAAPQDCSYGAAHGALEVYASTFPDGKLPKDEIPNLCNNPDNNNCTHGLGHLLLILSENDIEESLKDCERLPHNELGKFECFTGVFMERITAFNLVEHGLATEESLNWPARVPELETLCRKQKGVHSVACWKEIAHTIAVKFNNNSQQVINFCESAPGEKEARECIDHALGIMAGAFNFELARMTPICEARAKSPDFQNRCYAQLVAATLSTIPTEIAAAVKFCGNLESSYQTSCFTTIGNSTRRAKAEIQTLLSKECAKAPEEFQAKCQNGGNSGITFYTGD